MQPLLLDLKFAFRQLLKAPGFTAVAVLTLALGIGANTAIFSIVNAVLLRPAPYKNPDRLVWIWENNLSKNMPINPASPGNFNNWREQSRSFESLSAWEGENFNLSDEGNPESVLGTKTFANLLQVLGIQPVLGRAFRPDDDQAGATPVALLSYGLWQRRFGGETNILGKTLTVDGKAITVIGIVPGNQAVPFNKFELWIPFALDAQRANSHGDRFLRTIGRLKPGITLKQAQTELAGIARRLEQIYPLENTGAGVNIIPLKEMFSAEMRAPLLMLLGAVAFVLLIACANVANLMLARAAAREKEMALRAALGASRSRLVRQLFTETLLLCGLGTGLGLACATLGINVLRSVVPAVSSNYKVPIPGLDEIGIDGPVLLFTLGLSFVITLLCGLAPALSNSAVDLNEPLKEGGRSSTSGFRGKRLRSLLVISEVALALVLLIGAGLLIESFRHVREVPLGFDPRNVLTMSLSLPASKYPEAPQRADFSQHILERVQALPGVKSAAVANYLPLSGHWGTIGFNIEGHPALTPGDYLAANHATISPGYFATMKIPVIEGRGFISADRDKAPHVLAINQTMARQFWPHETPIGKRLDLGNYGSPDFWEIIGIVGDVKHFGPATEARPQVYFSQLQNPGTSINLVIRTTGEPLSLVNSVRAALRAVDPAQPVYNIQTLDHLAAQSIAPRRFAMQILAAFAGVALFLGAIGIYGVISYAVSKRTHEIGVRMALGAQRVNVLWLVVRQGMKLALIGIAAGLVAAVTLTRVLRTLLFEVKSLDPSIFLLVTFVLATVALLACWLPARRAAKIDPMEALRYE
jgi:putative ABC transport system permease protein